MDIDKRWKRAGALWMAWFAVCGIGVLGLAQTTCPSAAPAAIQADIERTVETYARAVSEAGGDVGPLPEVAVLNTPYLAHFSQKTHRIVIPYWPPQESTVNFFLTLTAGDEALARELFAELFGWFLVAHELTHWLQTVKGAELDYYHAEISANDGAVAFYNLFPESEDRLLRLDALLAGALERLSDPTPASLDPVTYFNAFYPSLAGDPYRYGYFQFRFIRESIARRHELGFAAFVAALGSAGTNAEP
ncbi:MAG: hypothetical protein NTY63_00730 [Candidatus Bipolaricaulota bacterium]|nr:hypothetical protein [Candidatus Bipolaricaulota bacterium]